MNDVTRPSQNSSSVKAEQYRPAGRIDQESGEVDGDAG